MRLVMPGMREGVRFIDDVIWQGTFDGRFADREHALRVFNEHNQAVQEAIPAESAARLRRQAGLGAALPVSRRARPGRRAVPAPQRHGRHAAANAGANDGSGAASRWDRCWRRGGARRAGLARPSGAPWERGGDNMNQPPTVGIPSPTLQVIGAGLGPWQVVDQDRGFGYGRTLPRWPTTGTGPAG